MTTSNNTGTLFQYKQYQCYYQDTLKRTSLLLLQWDNLLKLCPSKPFINFFFTTRGTWIMKNRPILSMIQKPYQNTAAPWKKLRGRSLYANFLSLLPLYSLLIFRARISFCTSMGIWSKSYYRQPTISTISRFQGKLQWPLFIMSQDFLNILSQRKGRRASKSTVTSNINQQGKLQKNSYYRHAKCVWSFSKFIFKFFPLRSFNGMFGYLNSAFLLISSVLFRHQSIYYSLFHQKIMILGFPLK